MGPINIPPDPGDSRRYRESSTLEGQAEEENSNPEALNKASQSSAEPIDDEPMPQGSDPPAAALTQETPDEDTAMSTATPHTSDVNGGIDDDDLLEIMATEVQAIHNTNSLDPSLLGPFGNHKPLC